MNTTLKQGQEAGYGEGCMGTQLQSQPRPQPAGSKLTTPSSRHLPVHNPEPQAPKLPVRSQKRLPASSVLHTDLVM